MREICVVTKCLLTRAKTIGRLHWLRVVLLMVLLMVSCRQAEAQQRLAQLQHKSMEAAIQEEPHSYGQSTPEFSPPHETHPPAWVPSSESVPQTPPGSTAEQEFASPHAAVHAWQAFNTSLGFQGPEAPSDWQDRIVLGLPPLPPSVATPVSRAAAAAAAAAVAEQDEEAALDFVEQLLEAYFMQVTSIENRLSTLYEYIDDTEVCLHTESDLQP